MREIEVAVGLTDQTWYIEWVKVEDEGIYLDETLTEMAERLALIRTVKRDLKVSFVKVIYIPEPEDDMDI